MVANKGMMLRLKGEGIIENETEQTKKALVCKFFTTVKLLRKNDDD
jgi:hypothetical protein